MKKQNVILKVVVGLALGFGMMALAPKAALASTPCTPRMPLDSAPCQPPQEVCVLESDTPYPNGCWDTDGDCVVDTYYVAHIKVYDCLATNGVHTPCQSTNYVTGVDPNHTC